jgi:CDP-diacylglycerol--glycerol-3-phosphate 3-phosphatidyltransferase
MMANVITGIRILVSVALLFCPVFSLIFYAMYLIALIKTEIRGCVKEK